MNNINVQVTYKGKALLGIITKEEETNLSVLSAFDLYGKVSYKEYLHNAKYDNEITITNI